MTAAESKQLWGSVEENQLLTSEKMQQAVYGRFHTDDIVLSMR